MDQEISDLLERLNPPDIIMSVMKIRTKEEIEKELKLINFLEYQCQLRRDLAYFRNDMELAWLMEGERVAFAAVRKAIRWSIGQEENLYDPETVAAFIRASKSTQEEILNNE